MISRFRCIIKVFFHPPGQTFFRPSKSVLPRILCSSETRIVRIWSSKILKDSEQSIHRCLLLLYSCCGYTNNIFFFLSPRLSPSSVPSFFSLSTASRKKKAETKLNFSLSLPFFLFFGFSCELSAVKPLSLVVFYLSTCLKFKSVCLVVAGWLPDWLAGLTGCHHTDTYVYILEQYWNRLFGRRIQLKNRYTRWEFYNGLFCLLEQWHKNVYIKIEKNLSMLR